jgi:hypothetical protein
MLSCLLDYMHAFKGRHDVYGWQLVACSRFHLMAACAASCQARLWWCLDTTGRKEGRKEEVGWLLLLYLLCCRMRFLPLVPFVGISITLFSYLLWVATTDAKEKGLPHPLSSYPDVFFRNSRAAT